MGRVLHALLAVAASLMTLVPAAPVHATVQPGPVIGNPLAHEGEVPNTPDRDLLLGHTTGFRPGDMMIGDSITHGGYPRLRALGVTWEISAIPGRNVSCLPYYIQDRLLNPSPLRMVVIALGTNAVSWWTKADYQRAVNLLPRSVRVVFVTTYRDPALWPETNDFRTRAWVQSTYSEWMREIVTSRPNTYAVGWRYFISHHKYLLHDGTHPTYEGWGVWARMVYDVGHKHA